MRFNHLLSNHAIAIQIQPKAHPILLIISQSTLFDPHNWFEAPFWLRSEHPSLLVKASGNFKNNPPTPKFRSIHLHCVFRNNVNANGNTLTPFISEKCTSEKWPPRASFRVMNHRNCCLYQYPKLNKSDGIPLSQAYHYFIMLFMSLSCHGGGIEILEGCDQSGGGVVIVGDILWTVCLLANR